MLKYKLILKPNTLTLPTIESGLNNVGGYLVYNNFSSGNDDLVNINNVEAYLENPNNSQVVDGFVNYLKSIISEEEFKDIYYSNYKSYPILNDYYRRKVRFNLDPTFYLTFNALSGNTQISYRENYIDYETNQRTNTQKTFTLDYQKSASTISSDYFITIPIDIRINEVLTTDYTKYLKDTYENGVFYKHSFVDLNNPKDPFEYWTNNNTQSLSQTAAIFSATQFIQNNIKPINVENLKFNP